MAPLPANLTAEAKAGQNRAQQTSTAKEKIVALQDFLSAVLKQRETNASVHRQSEIALLKAETETKPKRTGTRIAELGIKKVDAAQIVILGLTKVERSSLLPTITGAKPVVTSYPYATDESVAGMLRFEDAQFHSSSFPLSCRGTRGNLCFRKAPRI